MCNFILLSCDSDADLTQFSGEQLELTSLEYDLKLNPELEYLKYKHYWLLGATQSHGCACGFRHIEHFNHDLGFGIPESWWEEADEIEATKTFYSMIETLLKRGINVDSFDFFDNNDGGTPSMGSIKVSLNEITKTRFRFFEQIHFDYTI